MRLDDPRQCFAKVRNLNLLSVTDRPFADDFKSLDVPLTQNDIRC